MFLTDQGLALQKFNSLSSIFGIFNSFIQFIDNENIINVIFFMGIGLYLFIELESFSLIKSLKQLKSIFTL